MANTFGPQPCAQAQDYRLPAPGVMVHLSPPLDPPILKGIKVHPENPFRFDFILDKGEGTFSNDQLKNESSKLIKYFLASLTIPENDLWVNLSPYEKDRIIPQKFGLTEMGRDLLAEDYMLKQITATLIYPEDDVGKKFWKKIYEKAVRKYGTTDIPVNTFNKVWIVPEKAVVYENSKVDTAYVVESRLKVMLEQDYLSLQKHGGINSATQKLGKETNQLGSQIVREVVIPELTKEVNENKNFFKLRQVYNSLILATWYKKKIKNSIFLQIYADKGKVKGVNIDDPQEKERIYQKYLKAFKIGVFNYIKEDVDPVSQGTIPRKYFSGGVALLLLADNEKNETKFSGKDVLKIEEALDYVPADYGLFDIEATAMPEGKAPKSDGAMLSEVSEIEIGSRFDSKHKENPNRSILIGLTRDSDGKIQPIFSDSGELRSNREFNGIWGLGWNSNRQVQEIPLSVLGVTKSQVNKTGYWDSIPKEIADLFESGKILVTSNKPAKNGPTKSHYSVLMAVTPESGNHKSEGRSGVILRNGLPVVVNIEGKEFILEIKGLGNAQGGFDADYHFLRGGAQPIESQREFESLQMIRKTKGDSVRAVAEINFSVDGREQGYLIRLSPGSIRATYEDNPALSIKDEEQSKRVRQISRDMGKQMGEFFSQGFIPISHPENLIDVNGGERFIFTDYSDILPMNIFPTEIEGHPLDFFGVILHSLNTVEEIPGYGQLDGFEAFKEGLAGALVEQKRISQVSKQQLLEMSSFKDIRDFLWQKFFAAEYFKAIIKHGASPAYLDGLQDTFDRNLEEKIGEKAREKYKKNNDEIERLLKKQSQLTQEQEDIKKLEDDNNLLERTGFTAKGVKAMTDSEDFKSSLKGLLDSPSLKLMRNLDRSPYKVIWDLWGDNFTRLMVILYHLKEEIEFLEVVRDSIEKDMVPEVEENLKIAKDHVETIKNMTPHQYYQEVSKNPNYTRQTATLPYLKKDQTMMKIAQEYGGIDLSPANMNLLTRTDFSLAAQIDTGIKFHLDPALIKRLQEAPGFVPVVIQIHPVTDLRSFLGLADRQSSQQAASF
ncbi:MAG: hypothetical protein HQL12_09045 [Candidatus Omnitrophica bacterium]|nr:hypothetical protein [Candidatus Omnitrophota bacterium]